MVYDIENTFPELGYNELIAFLEREFNAPSSGGHNNFVNAILNGIIAGEDCVFLQELYADRDTYVGSFVVGGGYGVFIQDTEPIYWANDVTKFNVSPINGLVDFSPGETILYNNADLGATSPIKVVQVAEYKSFGTDLYSVNFKDQGGANTELAAYITSRITLDGYVTSYSINLKNLGVIFITFANSANRFIALTVPINEDRTQEIRLTTIGQQAAVPLTDSSRQYIDTLIQQGLVYEIT